jgi:hypothetical protein
MFRRMAPTTFGMVVADLVLDRPDEELLASVADEIVVSVPIADERERSAAVDLLVARLEVDRGVLLAVAVVLVVVAPVDVDPDAAELVDHLREAAEVDRDEVVDRQARQRLHCLDRALRAARRVRGVDAVAEWQAARTVNLDLEVAREGEQRDRLLPGIHANEHHRVRARRCLRAVALPVVVTEEQRDGRLAGERRVQVLRGLLHLDVPRLNQADGVLAVQPGAGGRGSRHHDGDRPEPEEPLPQKAPAAPARRRRLRVADDRRQRPGRQHGVAVPVEGRRSAYSTFESRAHRRRARARARGRIG